MPLRRTARIASSVVVSALSVYFSLAIWYWLPWPDWLRRFGSLTFPLTMIVLWFVPGRWLRIRRSAVAVALAAVAIAYAMKEPVEQNWVDLHARSVSAIVDGDIATITNFTDAIHPIGEPSTPRWTTRTFDLSEIEGAELIMQPFGNLKAMEHVMLSFGFADGTHIVVSIESRRTSWEKFDPLAGFFRHDQIYPMIGTERDLFWKRLAKKPPDNMQFYPILRSPEAIRAYLERVLRFANEVDERPKFYSTIRESCMTTLINLAPESFASVHWYDIRRWLPGYSLSLFQQLGLIDDSLPPAELAQKHQLRSGIRPPWDFPNDAAWSAYIRAQ